MKLLNCGALSFRMLLENSEHHFHGLLREVEDDVFNHKDGREILCGNLDHRQYFTGFIEWE